MRYIFNKQPLNYSRRLCFRRLNKFLLTVFTINGLIISCLLGYYNVAFAIADTDGMVAPAMTNRKYLAEDINSDDIVRLYGDVRDDLPSRYSLKDSIDLVVSNQGQFGLCAIFSAVKSIETNYALTHGNYIDLSERYIDYMTSNQMYGWRTAGTIGESGESAGTHGETIAVAEGFGIASEESVPYGDDYTVEQIQSAEPVVRVTETITFPGIEVIEDDALRDEWIKTIKAHIIKYGSVVANIDAPSSYNTDWTNGAYFYKRGVTQGNGGHGVSIVGWDDNYSRENFASFSDRPSGMPSSDGAFIILNSWGESWGDGGYLYASYESDNLLMQNMGVLGTSDVEPSVDYTYDDKIFVATGFSPRKRVYGIKYDLNDDSRYIERILYGISDYYQDRTDTRIRLYLNPEDDSFDADKLVMIGENYQAPFGGATSGFVLKTPVRLTGTAFALVFEIVGDMSNIAARDGSGMMYYADSLDGDWEVSPTSFNVRVFTVENEGGGQGGEDEEFTGTIIDNTGGRVAIEATSVNSFTVTSDKACVALMMEDDGVMWSRLNSNTVVGNDNMRRFSINQITSPRVEITYAGDVNIDSSVNVRDARKIVNSIMGITTLSNKEQKLADVDYNNHIDVRDARRVVNSIMGRTKINW